MALPDQKALNVRTLALTVDLKMSKINVNKAFPSVILKNAVVVSNESRKNISLFSYHPAFAVYKPVELYSVKKSQVIVNYVL